MSKICHIVHFWQKYQNLCVDIWPFRDDLWTRICHLELLTSHTEDKCNQTWVEANLWLWTSWLLSVCVPPNPTLAHRPPRYIPWHAWDTHGTPSCTWYTPGCCRNLPEARFRKNVRPQCNATFMATAQSSTIVHKWYSIFLKMVGKCNILIYTFQCLSCTPSEL